MQKLKVLVVYEEIPENTKFYALNVTPEDWAWMQLTHGHFVNACQPGDEAYEPCQKLSQLLQGEWDGDKFVGGQPEIEHLGPIPVTGYDFVLWTGFIL